MSHEDLSSPWERGEREMDTPGTIWRIEPEDPRRVPCPACNGTGEGQADEIDAAHELRHVLEVALGPRGLTPEDHHWLTWLQSRVGRTEPYPTDTDPFGGTKP